MQAATSVFLLRVSLNWFCTTGRVGYQSPVAPAGVGEPGHCPGISAHYISRHLSKRIIIYTAMHCARACIPCVRRRDVHVAMDSTMEESRASRHEASTVICVCPGYY